MTNLLASRYFPRHFLIGCLTFALCSLISLAVAGPASANFVALGTDRAGDSTDAAPGRDIVKVGLSYDRRSGHLRGGVLLRGPVTNEAPANLTLFAGRRTSSGCNGYPAIGFGTQTDLRRADWVLLTRPGSVRARGTASKLYSARAEEYQATARPLAGKRPNCVIAQLNEPGDSTNVFDVAGPFRLRGLPELEVRLGKLPPRMLPGRTRKIRVVVRNPGDAGTGRVRLAVPRARGMKVRLSRRVVAVPRGARRVVRLTVTLNRRARTFTTLRVKAKGRNGLRARDDGRLYLRKNRASKGKSRGKGGSKLCYRYTWLPPYSTLVPC